MKYSEDEVEVERGREWSGVRERLKWTEDAVRTRLKLIEDEVKVDAVRG